MIMWILKQNDEILFRTTLCTLTDSELASETEVFNKVFGTTLCNIGIKSYLGDFFDDTYMPSFTPYVYNEGIE